MSASRLEGVQRWLETRTSGTCPFCESRSWVIDDELSSFPTLQSEDPCVQVERGYTMVLVTCEVCGFTASFAAKKLGIEV
jgi:transcription elongation factor Elf1